MGRVLIFVILSACSLQSCIQQDSVSYQDQFKADTTSLGLFVRSSDPAAVKVNTGIWYSLDTLGYGVYPTPSDEVTISYTVKWINQSAADSIVGYSKISFLVLTSAISGLQQGLIFFPGNSFGRIYIPSGLAFGVTGHHDTTKISGVHVPPNANLLYEIKLINQQSTRLASDIAAIDSYLQKDSLKTLKDGSGIRYTIDISGQTSTNKPQPGDAVLVSYTENLLGTDSAAVNAKVKFDWKDQLTAWRITLQNYVTQGSTITMYVPSGYAYGSQAKGNIPANSNMKYVLKLDSIISQ